MWQESRCPRWSWERRARCAVREEEEGRGARGAGLCNPPGSGASEVGGGKCWGRLRTGHQKVPPGSARSCGDSETRCPLRVVPLAGRGLRRPSSQFRGGRGCGRKRARPRQNGEPAAPSLAAPPRRPEAQPRPRHLGLSGGRLSPGATACPRAESAPTRAALSPGGRGPSEQAGARPCSPVQSPAFLPALWTPSEGCTTPRLCCPHFQYTGSEPTVALGVSTRRASAPREGCLQGKEVGTFREAPRASPF
ncbi:uncharacterized protein [Vulpes vulpes]|uniref:Uncharacterized protein n=1 Tax=Vulpes vulpes TaxID=9627 RepID=A0ABM5A772_VULVU